MAVDYHYVFFGGNEPLHGKDNWSCGGNAGSALVANGSPYYGLYSPTNQVPTDWWRGWSTGTDLTAYASNPTFSCLIAFTLIFYGSATNSNMGVYARGDSATQNTLYHAYYDDNDNKFKIDKVISGTRTNLAQSATYARIEDDVEHTFSFVCNDSVKRILDSDGVTVLCQTTDNTINATDYPSNKYAGIAGYNTNAPGFSTTMLTFDLTVGVADSDPPTPSSAIMRPDYQSMLMTFSEDISPTGSSTVYGLGAKINNAPASATTSQGTSASKSLTLSSVMNFNDVPTIYYPTNNGHLGDTSEPACAWDFPHMWDFSEDLDIGVFGTHASLISRVTFDIYVNDVFDEAIEILAASKRASAFHYGRPDDASKKTGFVHTLDPDDYPAASLIEIKNTKVYPTYGPEHVLADKKLVCKPTIVHQYCDPAFGGTSDGSISGPWKSIQEARQNCGATSQSRVVYLHLLTSVEHSTGHRTDGYADDGGVFFHIFGDVSSYGSKVSSDAGNNPRLGSIALHDLTLYIYGQWLMNMPVDGSEGTRLVMRNIKGILPGAPFASTLVQFSGNVLREICAYGSEYANSGYTVFDRPTVIEGCHVRDGYGDAIDNPRLALNLRLGGFVTRPGQDDHVDLLQFWEMNDCYAANILMDPVPNGQAMIMQGSASPGFTLARIGLEDIDASNSSHAVVQIDFNKYGNPGDGIVIRNVNLSTSTILELNDINQTTKGCLVENCTASAFTRTNGSSLIWITDCNQNGSQVNSQPSVNPANIEDLAGNDLGSFTQSVVLPLSQTSSVAADGKTITIGLSETGFVILDASKLKINGLALEDADVVSSSLVLVLSEANKLSAGASAVLNVTAGAIEDSEGRDIVSGNLTLINNSVVLGGSTGGVAAAAAGFERNRSRVYANRLLQISNIQTGFVVVDAAAVGNATVQVLFSGPVNASTWTGVFEVFVDGFWYGSNSFTNEDATTINFSGVNNHFDSIVGGEPWRIRNAPVGVASPQSGIIS